MGCPGVESVSMFAETPGPPRFATQCLYLQVTMGHHRDGQGLVNLCRHIIRDGMECVGPFLEEHETTCGLWEARPARPR